MKEVLFQAETQYGEQQVVHQRQKQDARLRGQISMFDDLAPDPADQQRQKVQDIAASMLELVRQGRTAWEFEELLYELLLHGNWFARMSEKDFRAACKSLYGQNKIERLSSGNAWSKGTRFRFHPD